MCGDIKEDKTSDQSLTEGTFSAFFHINMFIKNIFAINRDITLKTRYLCVKSHIYICVKRL